jgi:hypothetical protein
VTRVEATYKAGLLNGTVGTDTRKNEAASMISAALSLEGIPMTADTQKLVDTVIPMLVMVLPKTHDDSVVANIPNLAQTVTAGSNV